LKITTGLKKSNTPLLQKSALKKVGTLKKIAVPKTKEQKELKKQELEKMWKMFQEIWEERASADGGHYSEISGENLGCVCYTVFMHHVFEKSTYPEYKYDKENIVMITWKEHGQLHQDEKFYSIINTKRKELKFKYEAEKSN
jgi:hypothetical protein